jgi:hypothetical protein
LDLVEFSPGGHLVATAGTDDDRKGKVTRGVRIHESASGTLWHSLKAIGKPELTGNVSCFAFSPDHRLFAAGFMPQYASGPPDNVIRVWDLVTGEQETTLEGHVGPVRCVAFSPDGKKLVSGSDDTTVLVWDVREFQTPLEATKPSPEGLTRLWGLLKGWDKETDPYKAAWSLAGAGDTAVAFLAERLSQVSSADPDRVKRWLAEINDDKFEVRSAATAELLKRGEVVEGALREALGKKPSLDAERILKDLLHQVTTAHLSVEGLRQSRAVLVLELIGTSAARDLLRKLGGGAEEARLTRDAKFALQRLDPHP